jgi:hypothetical protein
MLPDSVEHKSSTFYPQSTEANAWYVLKSRQWTRKFQR